MLLWYAVIQKFKEKIALDYPVDVFGSQCFRWGVEKNRAEMQDGQEAGERPHNVRWGGIGNCEVDHESGYIKFMDFPVNGEFVHHYFFNDRLHTNIFMDIAAGRTEHFSENDRAAAAEMVRKGYVVQKDGELTVNAPVFIGEQIGKLWEILDEPAEEIAAMCGELLGENSKVLQNHVPVHLKKQAKQMPFLTLIGDAISAPVRVLYGEGFLSAAEDGSMLPTTFVVLK